MIKNNIIKHIRSFIIRLFLKKGISVTIAHLKFLSIHKLLLEEIVFSRKNDSSRPVLVDSMIIHISIWRSLFSFSLIGEFCLSGISGNIPVLSNKPFSLKSVEFTFKFHPKAWLICIETGNIPIFFQIHNNKKIIEVYSEVKNIAWNNLISLLQEHLLFEPLKNSYSDSCISVSAYLKKDCKEDKIPFFNAKLETEHFALYCKNPKEGLMLKEWIINRAFLLDAIHKKMGTEQLESYTLYENLPINLINAVVCTEDPDFWNHSGISLYFVGYAIHENLKAKKVKRGGSTITMQLARNLFLSHNRTFIRKTEECIIALLLENHYKIGKHTILELYLNIIEFAPNIYGVSDAAKFYFNKTLKELTLTEIIVLTYIIPRPVHFQEALKNKTEQLQSNLYKHIVSYSNRMYRKKIINGDDLQNIDFSIHFAVEFGVLNLKKLSVGTNE